MSKRPEELAPSEDSWDRGRDLKSPRQNPLPQKGSTHESWGKLEAVKKPVGQEWRMERHWGGD